MLEVISREQSIGNRPEQRLLSGIRCIVRKDAPRAIYTQIVPDGKTPFCTGVVYSIEPLIGFVQIGRMHSVDRMQLPICRATEFAVAPSVDDILLSGTPNRHLIPASIILGPECLQREELPMEEFTRWRDELGTQAIRDMAAIVLSFNSNMN
jgi:hypothetical protein